MNGTLLAASDGLTNVNPVGGVVASAAMARDFYEGLQQHRTVAVALMPVVGQLPCGHREDLRCKPFGLDPWQDHEARVVDDQLDVSLSLGFAPPDGALPGLEFPGAGAKAEQREQLLAGKDVAADLVSSRCA